MTHPKGEQNSSNIVAVAAFLAQVLVVHFFGGDAAQAPKRISKSTLTAL